MSAVAIPTLRPGRSKKRLRPTRLVLSPPPLHSGDSLSRAEFERRYEAHPEIKKAELIEGVVYMSPPVRHSLHGRPHADLITWLGVYRAATASVDISDNATIRLDNENEYQPDALLRLPTEKGGRSRVTEDEYLAGAPELVVEVAASTAAIDAHAKKRVYARSGVQEYILVMALEEQIEWWVLREGVYEMLYEDEAGIVRSEVFPGLWLKEDAFWDGDLAQVLAVLQEGIGSEAHEAFVEQLGA